MLRYPADSRPSTPNRKIFQSGKQRIGRSAAPGLRQDKNVVEKSDIAAAQCTRTAAYMRYPDRQAR
jgi:hypothetical protein